MEHNQIINKLNRLSKEDLRFLTRHLGNGENNPNLPGVFYLETHYTRKHYINHLSKLLRSYKTNGNGKYFQEELLEHIK